MDSAIENPSPPPPVEIPKAEKEAAAYSLSSTIRKFGEGGAFKDAESRKKLLEEKGPDGKPVLTEDQMQAILDSNLVLAADNPDPKFNKEGFHNQKEWDEAVYLVAAGLLEKKKLDEAAARGMVTEVVADATAAATSTEAPATPVASEAAPVPTEPSPALAARLATIRQNLADAAAGAPMPPLPPEGGSTAPAAETSAPATPEVPAESAAPEAPVTDTPTRIEIPLDASGLPVVNGVDRPQLVQTEGPTSGAPGESVVRPWAPTERYDRNDPAVVNPSRPASSATGGNVSSWAPSERISRDDPSVVNGRVGPESSNVPAENGVTPPEGVVAAEEPPTAVATAERPEEVVPADAGLGGSVPIEAPVVDPGAGGEVKPAEDLAAAEPVVTVPAVEEPVAAETPTPATPEVPLDQNLNRLTEILAKDPQQSIALGERKQDQQEQAQLTQAIGRQLAVLGAAEAARQVLAMPDALKSTVSKAVIDALPADQASAFNTEYGKAASDKVGEVQKAPEMSEDQKQTESLVIRLDQLMSTYSVSELMEDRTLRQEQSQAIDQLTSRLAAQPPVTAAQNVMMLPSTIRSMILSRVKQSLASDEQRQQFDDQYNLITGKTGEVSDLVQKVNSYDNSALLRADNATELQANRQTDIDHLRSMIDAMELSTTNPEDIRFSGLPTDVMNSILAKVRDLGDAAPLVWRRRLTQAVRPTTGIQQARQSRFGQPNPSGEQPVAAAAEPVTSETPPTDPLQAAINQSVTPEDSNRPDRFANRFEKPNLTGEENFTTTMDEIKKLREQSNDPQNADKIATLTSLLERQADTIDLKEISPVEVGMVIRPDNRAYKKLLARVYDMGGTAPSEWVSDLEYALQNGEVSEDQLRQLKAPVSATNN